MSRRHIPLAGALAPVLARSGLTGSRLRRLQVTSLTPDVFTSQIDAFLAR